MKPCDQTPNLFPDLAPALAPAPAARRGRPAKAKFPAVPADASAPAAARSPALALDAAAMAEALEQHPDYRVVRRLRPRLQWPAASGPTFTVLLLDTETTGLEHAKDKVIELAMLRVEVDRATGQPVGEVQVYDALEDPGFPIPPEAAAVTGISDADVAGQRIDDQRVAELCQGVDWVVAHNAGFDRPFCEQRWPLFVGLGWACSFADIDWKAQGRGSSKLESLVAGLGLFYDAHRAEMDCHALLALLAAPLPLTPERSAMSLLLAQAELPAFRLHANAAPFEAKDLLKARRYRWQAELRVWQLALSGEAALQEELAWLKAQVYKGRRSVLTLERLTPQLRYAARSAPPTQLTL